MKRKDTKNLGKILTETLQPILANSRYGEIQAMDLWKNCFPETLQPFLGECFVKNKILYVKIKSSVLAHEVQNQRRSLIQKINSTIGQTVISDIKFY